MGGSVTTPSVDVGAVVSIETWVLFAPFELTIMGELSSISRSDLLLHRSTTWMLVSASSEAFFDWSGLCGLVGIVDSE